MEKINFAVCDDDEIVCDAVFSRVSNIFRRCGIEVSGAKYLSPVKLYQHITNPGEGERRINYDLICLDIDMPKLSGIDLGKAIKENSPETDIIFVSNREDRVFETFSVRPFGFIRKNNFFADLVDTLRNYIVTKNDTNNYLAVKTNNNSVTRKLKVTEIVYIESLRDHQFIYMADGEEIDIRKTMDELEEKLCGYDIVRTHKGYLVNYKYMARIDAKGITLTDGKVVGVSRNKIQDIKAQYLKYLRKTGAVLFTN